MNVERVASLFIRGAEEHIAGNDMVYALTFKEPADLARLFAAYQAMVRGHETLRLEWVENTTAKRFAWRPYDPAEVDARLDAERADFAVARPFSNLASAYAATNAALPIRLARVDDGRVLFLVNHVLANGYGGLYWLDVLLAAYAREDAPPRAVPARAHPRIVRLFTAVAGIFWALVYAIAFALRAGRHAARDTVDLTRGKAPAPHTHGYGVITHRLTVQDTDRVLRAAKAAGLSVTGAVAVAVARTLFATSPDKRRVCISVPVDIGYAVTGFSRELPGNFTGSLVVQLFKDAAPLERQVRAAFKGFARGVPYWLTRIVGAFARSERALLEKFAAQAALPIPARAPFENFSCAISSPGVMKSPIMRRHLDDFSGHTRTQTIFFAVTTIHGRLTLETSFSNDLFDASEVSRLCLGVVGALLGPSVSSSAAADATEASAPPTSSGPAHDPVGPRHATPSRSWSVAPRWWLKTSTLLAPGRAIRGARGA